MGLVSVVLGGIVIQRVSGYAYEARKDYIAF